MKRLSSPSRNAERSTHRAEPTERIRGMNRHPDQRNHAVRKTQTRSTSPSYTRVARFPQAKGKVLEVVEFSTSPGYHCISINFEDKTCLSFAIDTNFTLEADYSDWTTGNQRILREWPPISSQP